MKLALLSAFPQELKHIRKNLRAVKISTGGLCPIYLRRYLGCHIIAAHCGLGIENLESAFNYISKHYCPDVFVSLGFGGALYEGASIGDVVWASRYLLINGNDSNLKMISFVNHGYEKTGDDQILKKAWGKIAAREGTFVTLPKRISKKDLKNLIPSDILFPVCEQGNLSSRKIVAE